MTRAGGALNSILSESSDSISWYQTSSDSVWYIKHFISFQQAKHNYFFTLNSGKIINVISNRLLQVFGFFYRSINRREKMASQNG